MNARDARKMAKETYKENSEKIMDTHIATLERKITRYVKWGKFSIEKYLWNTDLKQKQFIKRRFEKLGYKVTLSYDTYGTGEKSKEPYVIKISW